MTAWLQVFTLFALSRRDREIADEIDFIETCFAVHAYYGKRRVIA